MGRRAGEVTFDILSPLRGWNEQVWLSVIDRSRSENSEAVTWPAELVFLPTEGFGSSVDAVTPFAHRSILGKVDGGRVTSG